MTAGVVRELVAELRRRVLDFEGSQACMCGENGDEQAAAVAMRDAADGLMDALDAAVRKEAGQDWRHSH